MNAHAPIPAVMPPRSPLAMPVQRFERTFLDPAAPGSTERRPWVARAVVFVPALLTSLSLAAICFDWFRKDGFLATETIMVALVAFSSFGIALSVFVALLALVPTREEKPGAGEPLDVALLMPVYREDPQAVFSRLEAMVRDLEQADLRHRYTLFVLSDTPEGPVAKAEAWAFARLQRLAGLPVHYRRRVSNVGRKTGNIADWVTGYGAAHDAFITLDADSTMSADALEALADDLSADPACALVQTVPRLNGGRSLFGRFMQFSNNIYGPWLARGLRLHCGVDGNYWGHNAIIRTRAFAACCGLPELTAPHLVRNTLGGAIKSHDFVEAALLIRAGWSVRIREDIAETWEEVPQTLVDHVLRDRRWCQGNLQHIGLLGASGFSLMSRFHMLQGAMAYLASVVWFALLTVWTIIGTRDATVLSYFSAIDPFFPKWPEMDVVDRWTVLFVMGVLLLLPKFVAAAKRPVPNGQGGLAHAIGVVSEIALSIALAPTMMVQHVLAVGRTFLGMDTGWAPQNREGTRLSLLALIRFHSVEWLIGALLTAGIASGLVSLWLSPIAISLVLAPALPALTAFDLPRGSWLMATTETLRPAAVLRPALAIATVEGPTCPETERALTGR
ncbi:MAG: glucans biosynthesis glucosyltransferase MdoH [Pseudomonadota bacterium]